MPLLIGKWEIAGSGEQQDNVQKETHVAFVMELTFAKSHVIGEIVPIPSVCQKFEEIHCKERRTKRF